MSRYSFAAVLACAFLAIVVSEELYSDKFDDIEAEAILKDDNLRNEYYKCFMDTGPCVTDAAVFFRQHVAEAVATRCRKCTDRQKENFAVMVEWYTDNRPDEWKSLMAKALEEAKAAGVTAV